MVAGRGGKGKKRDGASHLGRNQSRQEGRGDLERLSENFLEKEEVEMKMGGIMLSQRGNCPLEEGRLWDLNLSSAANAEAPLCASVSSSVKQKQLIFHRDGMRIIHVPCLAYASFMIRAQ